MYYPMMNDKQTGKSYKKNTKNAGMYAILIKVIHLEACIGLYSMKYSYYFCYIS